MSLEKTETRIDVILEALASDNNIEKSRSIIRLKDLFASVKDKEINRIVGALSDALKKEKSKIGKSKINSILKRYRDHQKKPLEERKRIIDELEAEEAAKKAEEEKAKLEAEEAAKKAEEEKARLEAEEATRLAEEKKAKLEAEEAAKIAAEEKEVSEFSYLSRRSKSRYPYTLMIVNIVILILPLIALGTIFAIGDFGGQIGVDMFGFAVFVAIPFFVVTTLCLLLLKQMIKLVLDFYDNTHMNSKVKIETLKVLKEISNNLENTKK